MCMDDYNWLLSSSELEEERMEMMAHLYDNPQLWEHTCMVAFAEHYLMDTADNDGLRKTSNKAYETFQRQKELQQQSNNPIFGRYVATR